MTITLKNANYEVVLNTHGGEINSFRSVKDGTKYVFEGPESVWKYHAPILFPHVGRIKDGFYTYNGKEYNLVNNGMSRDMEHTLVEQTQTSATFELVQNEQTLQKFPWKFSLKTHYELKDDGLIFTTTVTNTDNSTMLFSMGSHTAFCCPRNTDPAGTTNSDYQYEFEKKEPLTTVCLNDSAQLATDEEGTAPCTKLYGEVKPGIITIDAKGFGNGHFFTKITSDWVGLRNKKDGSLVKVNTKGYPYVMVWQGGHGEEGVSGNGFNCIEPWDGASDAENTDHVWEDKIGLISLESGKSYTLDQSITIEK
ncbi:aldose epimerase family protein [Treponema pectinovorum]|uniref:aldose epimerase family protein n=1 Tax=Treponema pectinovorum TaxID=164 RepID=UPI0021C3E2DB|nr:aldose 1-epimerase family protein [Treponema pectinovorum]